MKKSNSRVLTDKFMKNIVTPGRYWDSKTTGLYLSVRSATSKSWHLRVPFRGGMRYPGLGSFKDVSVGKARELAHDMRKKARAGDDPIIARKLDRAGEITFEQAARALHVERMKTWRNAKHQVQWLSSLENHAFGKLGKKPVAGIVSADVLEVLRPIWLTRPEAARRVKQRIAVVLDWAVAKGYRPEDKANAAIACRLGLQRQPKRDKHHAAVFWPDIPEFLARVREFDATVSVRLALEFTLLTAGRTGEVIGATWDEIEQLGAIWTIPAKRMKANRPHRVPLSNQAMEVLRDARILLPNSRYLFPSGRDPRKPLSNMAMLMLMRRMKAGGVPHGLRSSFRDWCAFNRKDRDLAEAALAHVVQNKTEAAYLRDDLLEPRRALMQEWADFATGKTVASSEDRAAA